MSKRARDRGTAFHTPIESAFAAPEMLHMVGDDSEEDSAYTSAVDMWSMGFLIHWLLTYQYPLPRAQVYAFCLGRRPLPTKHMKDMEVPDQVQQLIADLLRPDPEQRLTSAQALSHPWLQHLDDELDVISDSEQLDQDPLLESLPQSPSPTLGSPINEAAFSMTEEPMDATMDLQRHEEAKNESAGLENARAISQLVTNSSGMSAEMESPDSNTDLVKHSMDNAVDTLSVARTHSVLRAKDHNRKHGLPEGTFQAKAVQTPFLSPTPTQFTPSPKLEDSEKAISTVATDQQLEDDELIVRKLMKEGWGRMESLGALGTRDNSFGKVSRRIGII